MEVKQCIRNKCPEYRGFLYMAVLIREVSLYTSKGDAHCHANSSKLEGNTFSLIIITCLPCLPNSMTSVFSLLVIVRIKINIMKDNYISGCQVNTQST